jgi:hypothetical protein
MFAGTWADAATDGRLLLLAPALLSSVASISLCAIYYSIGTLLPWHIYAAVFLMSTCAVLREPMVDRLLNARLHANALARWIAWFQFSLGACDTLSPLVASIIVAGGGLKGVALFDSTASIIAVVALSFGADLVVPTDTNTGSANDADSVENGDDVDTELIDVERDASVVQEGSNQSVGTPRWRR